MKDLVRRAIDTARVRGAVYADARIVLRSRQMISVKNGKVEAASLSDCEGIGVRAIVDGAWGFASGFEMEPARVDEVAAEAVEIARSSAMVKK